MHGNLNTTSITCRKYIVPTKQVNDPVTTNEIFCAKSFTASPISCSFHTGYSASIINLALPAVLL